MPRWYTAVRAIDVKSAKFVLEGVKRPEILREDAGNLLTSLFLFLDALAKLHRASVTEAP